MPLPTAPAEANISLLQDEQPANIDTARAVASQFGIQGKIFETPGRLPRTISYLVTDGKQRLYVQSSLNYDYYADYGAYSYMSGGKNISEEQAATVIDAFMKSHGLNFEYKLENPQINPGMYYVLPLTPDRMPVYHNYNIPERLEFTVDENEQVILMTSYQIKYEIADAYGIRTADEAFQQVLNQSDAIQNGVLEIVRPLGFRMLASGRGPILIMRLSRFMLSRHTIPQPNLTARHLFPSVNILLLEIPSESKALTRPLT